ncbi:CYP71D11, partial [Symbiodinium natans]
MILYLSRVMEERRVSLLDLASRAARELNPLALKAGQSSWPFFGLMDQLQLIWQAGQHAAPLLTDPWRLPPACPTLPSQPFRKGPEGSVEHLGGLAAAWGWQGPSPAQDFSNNSVLRLARNLRPGAILVDAGVFDGTDWSLMGILAGATVLGFEPLRENRKLVDERLPAQLHQHGHPQGTIAQAYSFLPIAPGEPAQASDLAAMTCRDFKVVMHGFAEARRKLTVYLEVPRMPWLQIAPAGSRQRLSGDGTFPVTFPCDLSLRIPWLCDALQVRSLNMTVRYDYSSIADQGYLTGPPNMEDEEVALTTLDEIFGAYLSDIPTVELLKLDVEGYEMGALRGAEWLLSEGSCFLLAPGMDAM